jgi:Ca2+-dependent lipid-binding protein
MMYYPNTFTLNLEQMLSGAPIDTAVGIVAITVYNGRGLKGTKLGGGAPDPYISMSIDGRAELAKTKIKRNT